MPDLSARVVLLAPTWLGDAVMALPALRDVRHHFADGRLAVAARPSVAPLFRSVPGVDEIVTLSSEGGSSIVKSWRHDVRTLREGRYDIAILLPNSFYAAWIARSAGVPERWGYRADFRRRLLTRAIARPPRKVSYGAYYQELLRALDIETGPLTSRLAVSQASRETAKRLLEREGWSPGQTLIGIAPGAAYGHAKQWPPFRFAELIRLLADRLNAACVLVGRQADRDAGQEIASCLEQRFEGQASPRLINLIGRTDLQGLLGVMWQCQAFIANDSGALHLAAAIGVPVTAIYGPTDERYSQPLRAEGDSEQQVIVLMEPVWCRPCGLRECPIDHRCMTRITASRAFDAVRSQMQIVEAVRRS